jgi:hypothetical protein
LADKRATADAGRGCVPARANPPRGTALLITALAAVALLAALVMLGRVHRIDLRIPGDENEGWNAYHAQTALAGGALYPPADSLISNNYPPLSFFVVAALARPSGDCILAGRWLALLSELLVAVNLFSLTRYFCANPAGAALASLAFLLCIGVNAQDYVAMDDPQWLGAALMTTGAVLFLRASERSSRKLEFTSAVLCVTALFVKHNLMALPLALAIWALLVNRRALLGWLLMSLALGFAGVGYALELFGPNFLIDVLHHSRVQSSHKMLLDGMRLLAPLTPLVLCTALLALLAPRAAGTRLVLIYAAISLALGLTFLRGIGTDVNMLFDFVMALCLGAGLLLDALLARLPAASSTLAPAALVLGLAAVAAPMTPRAIAASRALLVAEPRERLAHAGLIETLSAARGPVACEQLSLCYWAGLPFEIDFSNYGKKLHAGAVDPAPLRRRIDAQDFALIETEGPPGGRGKTTWLLGEVLSDLIADRYVRVQQAEDQWILAPRGAPALPVSP